MFPYPESEHQARVMCNDPAALAYEWIKGYAANLSDPHHIDEEADEYGSQTVSAEELIETAMSNIQKEGWDDYICKGGLLEGESVDPTFWDKLAIFKGITIPQEKRNSFFTCSC